MAVKITYFVHGTTTDNEQEISSGWKDVGLSSLGIQQSRDLKEKVKDKILKNKILATRLGIHPPLTHHFLF